MSTSKTTVGIIQDGLFLQIAFRLSQDTPLSNFRSSGNRAIIRRQTGVAVGLKSAPEQTSFHVASWNVRGKHIEHLEGVSDLLNLGGTDLIGLQELGGCQDVPVGRWDKNRRLSKDRAIRLWLPIPWIVSAAWLLVIRAT